MKLISYADLARMRLRHYVDDDSDIEVEESGMEGLVGLGGWEKLGDTYFSWRQDEDFQTAGIDLDFGPDSLLPRAAANKILEQLGIPVRPGATSAELVSTFGSPREDRPGRPGARLLDFVCGESEPFLIGCVVDERDGLVSLFIARKDYCDEDDSV